MRVKRFIARNMQDAMLQVKIEMGKDAVILHTRKFKEGGFLGLFSKEFVEVTAAVDQEYLTVKNENKTLEKPNKQILWPQITEEKKVEQKSELKPENKAQDEEKNDLIEQTENKIHNGNSELADMKHLMEEIREQVENVNFNIGLNKVGEQVYQKLIQNEVEEKLARRLVKKSIDSMSPNQLDDLECIKKQLYESICRILKKSKPIILPKRRRQQVFALVGPTGVGKTTTIAKLAANFAINNKKSIALITSDTYRIAAVEQLKTVGEIIGVPVEVVFTPQSMKNSILNHSDKDLIFIDTAGRSHKNALHMSELNGFLDAAEPDEVFLVLSATTKYKDMLEIVEKYQKISFKTILFTKLDETTTYGPILSIIYKSKKYLSYFSTGQSVPDDIEVADPKKMAQLILEDGAE